MRKWQIYNHCGRFLTHLSIIDNSSVQIIVFISPFFDKEKVNNRWVIVQDIWAWFNSEDSALV